MSDLVTVQIKAIMSSDVTVNNNHFHFNSPKFKFKKEDKRKMKEGKEDVFVNLFLLSKSYKRWQLADTEEEFLHAAEFGDIPTVKRILQENPNLNVDCIDALGRTALRLSVKNEHLEVSFHF